MSAAGEIAESQEISERVSTVVYGWKLEVLLTDAHVWHNLLENLRLTRISTPLANAAGLAKPPPPKLSLSRPLPPRQKCRAQAFQPQVRRGGSLIQQQSLPHASQSPSRQMYGRSTDGTHCNPHFGRSAWWGGVNRLGASWVSQAASSHAQHLPGESDQPAHTIT